MPFSRLANITLCVSHRKLIKSEWICAAGGVFASKNRCAIIFPIKNAIYLTVQTMKLIAGCALLLHPDSVQAGLYEKQIGVSWSKIKNKFQRGGEKTNKIFLQISEQLPIIAPTFLKYVKFKCPSIFKTAIPKEEKNIFFNILWSISSAARFFPVQNDSNASMKMENERKNVYWFSLPWSWSIIYCTLYMEYWKICVILLMGKNSHMMHRGNNAAALHIRIPSKRN